MPDISPIATSDSFKKHDQSAYLRRLLTEATDFIGEPWPTHLPGRDPAAAREAWLHRFRQAGLSVTRADEVAHPWAELFVSAMTAVLDFRLEDVLVRLEANTDHKRRALAVFRLALREAHGQSVFRRPDASDAERQEGSQALVESRPELWQLLNSALAYDPTAFAAMRDAFQWVATELIRALDTNVAAADVRVGPVRPSAIVDSLLAKAEARRQEEEVVRQFQAEREHRLAEHGRLRACLARAFDEAHAFPGEENALASKPSPEGFQRWAVRIIAVGTILRECDAAIDNLNLVERLRNIAPRAAPPALAYACAVLVLASEGQAEDVATALEKANGDGELRLFVLWLPYTLDHLWHPFSDADGLTRLAAAPEGTSHRENL
jgi:hypothetical protein